MLNINAFGYQNGVPLSPSLSLSLSVYEAQIENHALAWRGLARFSRVPELKKAKWTSEQSERTLAAEAQAQAGRWIMQLARV